LARAGRAVNRVAQAIPVARVATGRRRAYFSCMSETADLTRNQHLVLDALTGATGPLSAYGILDRLRGDGIKAPLQIYRALDKLVELGLAHRLESLNAFVACAHAEDHHHRGLAAFAICEACGRVDEFADSVVEERLSAWSRSTGFKAERTTIEIRGHCQDCVAGGR
jgi:Fur family transcriptional regulator, zinc uptake regulator